MTGKNQTKKYHLTLPLLAVAAVVLAGSVAAAYVVRSDAAQVASLPCDSALLIGHRGTSLGVARNNSLDSLLKAASDGAEVIELDIHRTKPINGSGTWVVWHDASIQGKKIASYTYTQLKAIQPDLITIRQAVASVASTGKQMEVEVKPANTGAGSFSYFKSLAVEYGMTSKLRLSSFDVTNLARAKAAGMNTVYLSSVVVAPATIKTYANILHLNKNAVTSKAIVDSYHKSAIKVQVYTSNTPEEWTKYLGFGVDGITTDVAATYVSYCNAQQV